MPDRGPKLPSPPAFRVRKVTDCDVSQLSVDWQLVTEQIVKEDGDNLNLYIPRCNFTARQPFPVKVMDVGRYFTL